MTQTENARSGFSFATAHLTEKEFAFTKLFPCGHCGSGISAREKFKKLKNGKTIKYNYYGCTKAKDKNCKHGYLREEDIIRMLQDILDKVDINEIGVKNKFEEEVKRYNKFQKGVLGIEEGDKPKKDIDLKTYLKYILQSGTMDEKRDAISCLKSKIVMTDRKLDIAR